MPRTVQSAYPVTVVGVGRKDYSQSIEQAISPMVASRLDRYIYSGYLTIPGFYCNIPLISPLTTLVNGVFQFKMDLPLYLYELNMTLDMNDLMYLGLAEYDTEADMFGDTNRTRIFGFTWNIRGVNTTIQRGIKTIIGKYYSLLWAVYDPLFRDFNVSSYVTGVEELVA